MTLGNHDQHPSWSSASSATNDGYNSYFGASRFAGRSYYGGHFGGDNDNHFDLFQAGGVKFIVINLECFTGLTSNSETVLWARDLLRAFPNRMGIVVSHFLIDVNGAWSTYGNAIWNGLKNEANLFLMLCGHRESEAMRVDTRTGMEPVYTLMADYCARTHGGVAHGGNGWMRILTFAPSLNEIRVQTFSPTMNNGVFNLNSPNGQFELDSDSNFVLSYDFGGTPLAFSELGRVSNVPSGSQAQFTWEVLLPATHHEWQVEVVIGGESVLTGPIWKFQTTLIPTCFIELSK